MVRETFEGVWEELARAHGPELAGRRVRLTVLDGAAPDAGAPNGHAKPAGSLTLAEMMKDYIGSVKSDPPKNLSGRVSEVFGEIIEQKHRKWKPPQ